MTRAADLDATLPASWRTNNRIAAGDRVPPSKAYVRRNLPLDVLHVLTYFIAHEGHHRGQIVLLARQLGHRLPADISSGLWQWTKRAPEARGARR
jgi:uncharacterized damage-inducible protein DinB